MEASRDIRERMNITPTATPPPFLPPPPAPSPLGLYDQERQTLALIRRILRPQSSPDTLLDEILPALTSSSGIDVQLYAFLAIICRDFIFAWYSKITNDRSFVDEIIKVVAHTTRSLEQRLRQIDLEVLLLDEIPSLLDNHVRDFRQCVYRHKTSLCPHLSIPEIFHNIQPHPALKSSPETERLYLKLLSSGILAVLLPTEDLQSNCERTLIREILSGLVFWNVVDKLSEPWLLYDIFAKVLGSPPPSGTNSNDAPAAPSEVCYSGEDDSSLASISRKDEALKKKRRKFRRDDRRSSKHHIPSNELPRPSTTLNLNAAKPPDSFSISSRIENALIRFALLINLATAAISSIYTFINHRPPLPRRKKPILRMSFLKFFSNLLRMEILQPWLKGNILLALSPFAAQPAGSLIDSFLSDLFRSHVTSQELLIRILALARTALFPNGAMGPPKPYPTPAEQAAMRDAAREAILGRIPRVVKVHYFGDDETEWKRAVDGMLDILGEKEVNKHMVYQVLELVVVRLVPEIGEVEVWKLMGERVGTGVGI